MTNAPIVYVIDDDDAARHSLRFLVECAGHEVRDYDSALAFLAALPEGAQPEPGCIVTDVRMPEMTGVELIERLKQLQVREPVIVITGHADVPMAIQAMKAGVSDFIEKPFAEGAMLAAIETALARRSLEARAHSERSEVERRIESLSTREREVMEALVEGKANKVIAFDLGISARTVEVYRAHVMAKMRVKSLSELVRLALSVKQDGAPRRRI
jgi:two-component system response regulator FixJ